MEPRGHPCMVGNLGAIHVCFQTGREPRGHPCMLSDRILATLARRENAEALRQPSNIQKNVNQHIEMNADRTGKATKHYRRP